jgi:streptogramin lyase
MTALLSSRAQRGTFRFIGTTSESAIAHNAQPLGQDDGFVVPSAAKDLAPMTRSVWFLQMDARHIGRAAPDGGWIY